MYLFLYVNQPLSLFFCMFLWLEGCQIPLSILFYSHFLELKSSEGKKKSIGRKFQFLSFKSFSICAEDRAGLEITCCFWHNPLGFEDVRVESISDLCCFQQQRQLLELKDWSSILDCIEKDAVYFLISDPFLTETTAQPGCCWGCRQAYFQEITVLWSSAVVW